MKISALLSSLALAALMAAGTVGQAQPIEVETEVLEALKPQMEKEKRFGYTDFKRLYVARGGNRVRLVYTTTNVRLDSKRTKYLTGFTVTGNGRQWLYVGGITVSYLTERDFVKIKSWADAIGKR